MEKILKKAELINTLSDSVVIVMLVQKHTEHGMLYYTTEADLFKLNGEHVSKSIKPYTSYKIAAKKYSSLIHMLS